ncbi:phage protease [Frigidibacter oleivorans]|uniref:phage protease n=1 Tax=Frigidibacter oleivorans TaxID=2487129 RepID=UPI000F8D042B|nr:phage protease [Frigidibacter oleivorans]
MSKHLQIALMQALDLPPVTDKTVPDWIHLLPAGAAIMTGDNRGPYRVTDPQEIVASAVGKKLPIDENHAIDWAAPRGEPSPARGYILELQARDDGIWGRVDWTEAGRALMADRAYLGISPAVIHDGDKRIFGIARASLTNKPNLRGLTSLHMESEMDLSALAKALGLADDATMEAILAAVRKLNAKPDPATVDLQSQIGQIGVALGVAEGATPETILAAAKTVSQTDDKKVIVALQSELTTLATKLNEVISTGARARAEGFVDAEIKRGRVGVKPLREHYIAMHMEDAARVEKEIAALPVIGAGNTILPALPAKEGELALQSEHVAAARALGLDPKTYAAALKADNEEAL